MGNRWVGALALWGLSGLAIANEGDAECIGECRSDCFDESCESFPADEQVVEWLEEAPPQETLQVPLDEESARQVAETFLREHGDEFGATAEVRAALAPVSARHVGANWAFAWKQTLNGRRVIGAEVGLGVSVTSGRVVAGGSSLVPGAEGEADPKVDEAGAASEASAYLGEPADLGIRVAGLAYLRESPGSDVLTLVYVVETQSVVGGEADLRRVLVDAVDGVTVADEDVRSDSVVDGEVRGPVFPNGPDEPVGLAGALSYLEVDILAPPMGVLADDQGFFHFDGLPALGPFTVEARIRGHFVDWSQSAMDDEFTAVENVAPNGYATLEFSPTTEEEDAALNVYWWLNEHMNHLVDDVAGFETFLTLGPPHVYFTVLTEAGGDCNAASGLGTINLGTYDECLSDPALDGEIVIHEWGHLLQDKLDVEPLGTTLQQQELNEANADAISLFFVDLDDDALFGANTWGVDDDATRHMDNTFTTDDWGDPSEWGLVYREIYSGALWDVRQHLGEVVAEQLFYDALQSSPRANTAEGLLLNHLTAMGCNIVAGTCDGGTTDVAHVRQAFRDHGIGADAYIRDNFSDDGTNGVLGGFFWWKSPDLCVEPCAGDGDVALAGIANDVRVTVHALDNSYGVDDDVIDPTIENLQVHAYYALASSDPSFPADYTEVDGGAEIISLLASGDSEEVTLTWTPPAVAGYCFLVRLVSPCDMDADGADCDPVTEPNGIPYRDNSITQKNIQAILGRAILPPPLPSRR